MPCFISYSKAKFACYPRCFLTFYFSIQVPYNEKGIFLWVLVLKDLVGLHRTIQLSFFSITGWGIGLDYHDIEWFALERNRDHSVIFEIASKDCILYSFVDYRATPFLLRDSYLHHSLASGQTTGREHSPTHQQKIGLKIY